MGRPRRVDVAGYVYHAVNRSVGRRRLFRGEADFLAFERVLAEAVERSRGGVELLAYCVMGNHWHLAVRTTRGGALSPFMQWLTLTHTQRYRVAHGNVGHGPVYQGRFKSFVVADDPHLFTLLRYVERNAARASLVTRAEDWPWSSLWQWLHGPRPPAHEGDPPLVLSPWPTPAGYPLAPDGSRRPANWLGVVNTPLSKAELTALRLASTRCRPYGDDAWVQRMVETHGLHSTTRPPGRPPGAGEG